jgi:hypothetical protein
MESGRRVYSLRLGYPFDFSLAVIGRTLNPSTNIYIKPLSGFEYPFEWFLVCRALRRLESLRDAERDDDRNCTLIGRRCVWL